MNNLFYHNEFSFSKFQRNVHFLGRGQIWSKFYHLDSTHFEFIICLLISNDIYQEIELTSITHVNEINFITDNDVVLQESQ